MNETFSSLTSIMALCGIFLVWSTKRRFTSCCTNLNPALVRLKFSMTGLMYLAGRPRPCTFFSFSFGFGSSFLIWNMALCDSWRTWVMAFKKLPNPKSSGKVLAQCEVMRNLLKTLKIIFEKKHHIPTCRVEPNIRTPKQNEVMRNLLKTLWNGLP